MVRPPSFLPGECPVPRFPRHDPGQFHPLGSTDRRVLLHVPCVGVLRRFSVRTTSNILLILMGFPQIAN